jgi:hypothetical protein
MFLTGAEPTLSSARVIFPACVNVVSWNSIFFIFQAEKDYDPFAEWRRPTVAEKEDEYRQKRQMMIMSPEQVDPFAEGMATSPQLVFYLDFSPFNWRNICTVIVLLLIFVL